jgi:pantothenate kinase
MADPAASKPFIVGIGGTATAGSSTEQALATLDARRAMPRLRKRYGNFSLLAIIG